METKFQIGDKVKVRDWDKMSSQYPLDEDYGIDLPGVYLFSPKMKEYCGKVVTIATTDAVELYGDYYDYYNIEEGKGEYGWTNAMFTKI